MKLKIVILRTELSSK